VQKPQTTTSTQEGAIAVYESMGFVERGRTQNRIWTQVWMEYLPGGAAPPGSTQSNP
jgi:hypothetical protein